MNILVTRPQHQAESLCQLIEQQGWNAVRFPTLEIEEVDYNEIRRQIAAIAQYDWLIFISSNAVNFALKANNGKIDSFRHCSIAAVGKATEKILLDAGLTVDLLPEANFNTEGLLATDEMKQIAGQSCLIVRGVGGREELAQTLKRRGAKVDYLEVYKRVVPLDNKVDVADMLQRDVLNAITITSGDALKHLLLMVDNKCHPKLTALPLVVISERIKQLAKKYKFKQIAVAESPCDAAIIKMINGECSG